MKDPRTWGGSPDSEMDVSQVCLLRLFDLGQRCRSLRAGVGWIVKSEASGFNGFISKMRKLGSGDVTLWITQGLHMGHLGAHLTSASSHTDPPCAASVSQADWRIILESFPLWED